MISATHHAAILTTVITSRIRRTHFRHSLSHRHYHRHRRYPPPSNKPINSPLFSSSLSALSSQFCFLLPAVLSFSGVSPPWPTSSPGGTTRTRRSLVHSMKVTIFLVKSMIRTILWLITPFGLSPPLDYSNQ
uniref:Uncharacterized protein n=1 Tax=Opuntia streptacantha TaxID=393608 RepID=A0A7C9EVD6_OPUST